MPCATFLITTLLLTFQPAERPPNVVLIMADDLGWNEVGAYGQDKIRTPNMDRLAREGMRFTDHYSGSTVCAPSRCVLMTGKHTG
ncbi:MAG: sulfatase-like hydrolase/transferase, partial [Phycisphaerales bacterium]|nr:sulfatase-like hydrolase/transferase [Phycisphaerales bacterium]